MPTNIFADGFWADGLFAEGFWAGTSGTAAIKPLAAGVVFNTIANAVTFDSIVATAVAFNSPVASVSMGETLADSVAFND